jgi:hypothetical protein
MLPPVLEIYVVWHPDDGAGAAAAEEFVQHFHGTLFTGLIGGAVEVYVRSQGWRRPDDAPRPIPLPGVPLPSGLQEAQLIAVVPVLGMEFAAAVQSAAGPWYEFATAITAGQSAAPDRVGIFPLLLDRGAVDETVLGRIFGGFQRIGDAPAGSPTEPAAQLWCRDLAQGIAQLASGTGGVRLTAFISHTKRAAPGEEADVSQLIEQVRSIIAHTRLDDFFDANDLQPGRDWSEELRASAATSALLAIRSDLYASRTWCQREMLIAKRHGMPVVILDALGRGEERGSFLMDHVPRVPVRNTRDGWQESDIRRGLNLLVDDCLKRALWRRQGELAAERPDLEVAWWAPHAPEPATLVAWLEAERVAGRLARGRPLRILHPDPPLGADEIVVLEQMATLGGVDGPLDILTPRLLAARGG